MTAEPRKLTPTERLHACPKCNGFGTVRVLRFQYYPQRGKYVIECDKCGGTGATT